MLQDTVDRRFVSRYSQPGFGIKVYQAGVLADADALPVASLLPEGTTTPEWTATATHDELGSYSVLIPSTVTATPHLATLMWNYALSTVQQIYGIDIEVGESSPAYDALPPAWQDIIEQVWIRFADLFDSPYGGPNLAVYAQTHFGRNRIAQLMPSALQRLNTASTPHKTYPLGGTDFPFDEWQGLLVQALYIEAVKHLIRGYLEQPEAVLATSVSRVDRRDYFNRWQEMISLEDRDFRTDLSRYKMAHMGLGNVSVLVSGGAFGDIGYGEPPGGLGAAAARGYFYYARWH